MYVKNDGALRSGVEYFAPEAVIIFYHISFRCLWVLLGAGFEVSEMIFRLFKKNSFT